MKASCSIRATGSEIRRRLEGRRRPELLARPPPSLAETEVAEDAALPERRVRAVVSSLEEEDDGGNVLACVESQRRASESFCHPAPLHGLLLLLLPLLRCSAAISGYWRDALSARGTVASEALVAPLTFILPSVDQRSEREIVRGAATAWRVACRTVAVLPSPMPPVL